MGYPKPIADSPRGAAAKADPANVEPIGRARDGR